MRIKRPKIGIGVRILAAIIGIIASSAYRGRAHEFDYAYEYYGLILIVVISIGMIIYNNPK